MSDEKPASSPDSSEVQLEVSVRPASDGALPATEERLDALILASDKYGFFVMDGEGQIVGWNRGAQRLFGYADEEIVGQHFRRLFTPEDVESGAPEAELARAEAAGAADDDRWHVRKDGTRVWINGVTTALKGTRSKGFAKLIRDMTGPKILEENLQQRTLELAEAGREKDRFLAVLSHELRNPLAPIRTAAYLIAQKAANDPELARTCTILTRQIETLTRLVDDLLDVARITSGKIQVRRQPVELGELVARAAEAMRGSIEEHGHKLALSLSTEPIWIDADAVRIEQVVGNLLNNAAKFTLRPGEIYVSLEHAGGVAILRVRDTGVGIPAELMPRLFTLFSQGSSSEGGLGIGLSLVRTLVEMHGGSVEAQSDGPGTGSEFVVRLPSLPAAP